MSLISTIDCGYLAVVQAMAADRWLNAGNKKDYIANVESAKAVLENQSGINLIELKDPGKEKKISLEWPTKCSITVGECSDDCTITGTDVTPECKEYSVSCLAETSFVIAERTYREKTMEMQQAMADNLLKHIKAMDEEVAAVILAGVDAAAGVNVFTDAPGTVSADITYINANNWNEYLFGYFALAARMNKFSNPTILDGKNLFLLWWNLMKEGANADGKGAMAKLTSINTPYFDPENIIGAYAGRTYMIDNGAVYFASKTWNPAGAANAIRKAGTDLLYSIPSNNLPGINYDVIVREACSSNDYQTQVKIQLHGVFATNPTPCDETNTGVLIFKCGAAE